MRTYIIEIGDEYTLSPTKVRTRDFEDMLMIVDLLTKYGKYVRVHCEVNITD